MQRLGPTKKKEKEKQWVCWLFRPLDCLYALNREWTLYKRWVTDQWRLITHKRVSFTQQISSLALICDAKTWSHKKKGKGKAVSVLIVSATGLSLCTEQRVDFVQEMGDWSVKADHPQKSQFHPTNLFLSLNLWCKDLVPQKKRKRKSSECVDCFGHWTVFMHWTESGLCTRDGWLISESWSPTKESVSPNKSLP